MAICYIWTPIPIKLKKLQSESESALFADDVWGNDRTGLPP